MGHLLTRTQIQRLVAKHGREVIEHRHMQIERCCYQHGNVTTFEHSVRVACLAVWMADRAHLWYRVDLKSLIRAALLHDYFLVVPEFLRTLVFARPRGDDQFADCTFSPSLDMSR